MIEVRKCYIDCDYINDYWKDNLIINQSKNNKSNENSNNLTIDINSYNDFKKYIDDLIENPDELLNDTKKYNNEEYIDDNLINKEKLNYNHKARISSNPNVFRKKYIDSYSDRNSNKSNNTRTNTQYYSGEGFSRKQDLYIRMHDKQKSGEYRILQKYSNTNEDKGKMYNLPEKCRIHEYVSRERKILLDSFSKPKLLK